MTSTSEKHWSCSDKAERRTHSVPCAFSSRYRIGNSSLSEASFFCCEVLSVCFSVSPFQHGQTPQVASFLLLRKSFSDYYEEFLEKKSIRYVPIRFHKDKDSNREESLEETIIYLFIFECRDTT